MFGVTEGTKSAFLHQVRSGPLPLNRTKWHSTDQRASRHQDSMRKVC